MNNNIKFDPNTGQPIIDNQNILNNQLNSIEQPQPIQIEQATPVQNNVVQQNAVQMSQTQIQNIPTVEQNKEQFIQNTQNLTTEKKEEKKQGINYTLIIVLFILIFASIFFLFPFLLKYI